MALSDADVQKQVKKLLYFYIVQKFISKTYVDQAYDGFHRTRSQ